MINTLLVNKDLIILLLIGIIIFVLFYDKLLPLIIQFNFNYINTIVMFIPIVLLLLLVIISICSKFKIYNSDALFGFNHQLMNHNKYKQVIDTHILNNRKKIMNITNLYNKEYIKKELIKQTLISNLKFSNNIKTIIRNLKWHCNKVNNFHNEKLDTYVNKTESHINRLSDKASKIWNTF